MENREVRFTANDNSEIRAHLALPGSRTAGAGVIVIQEIFGLTDFIRGVADRLAEQGYIALAPHLYSRKEQDSLFTQKNIMSAMMPMFSIPPEKRRDPAVMQEIIATAGETEKKILTDLMINRQSIEETMVHDLESTFEYLRTTHAPQKMGVIGFCMGGGLTFQVSTKKHFDASAVFYGANPRPLEGVATIKGAVLGIYAGEDGPINQGLPDLMKAIIEYKTNFEMKMYPGTHHAFFNHTGPAYNEAAAKDAWERTLRFFKHYLGD